MTSFKFQVSMDMAGERILIVDDERLVAREAQATLIKMGYVITGIAISGEAALQQIEECRPDLVLMDIHLSHSPDVMDGIETAGHIRTRFDIPVIYLTAYADEEIIQRAKITQPFGYIFKPLRARELATTIEMALYKHRLEMRLKETNRHLEEEILERKQAEQELTKYRDHLEVLVAERTVELKKANEQLRQEIAERKRAKEALQESEERYRPIFEQAADSILLIDPENGEMVEFNDKTHDNLGYTREEFRQLQIHDFEIIESAEDVAKHIDKIIREGSDIFETKHRTKNGEIRNILVNSKTLVIHGKTFIQSIWRDITERKRAEDALRQTRKDWEKIFQVIGHPTVILDKDHHILDANRATLEAVGLTREELKTKKCFEIFHYSDHYPETCPLRKLLWSEHFVETIEMEIEAFNGTFLVSCTPVLDEHGELQKIIHMATDITERKRAEETLRNYQEHLEEMVAARTAELQDANRQLAREIAIRERTEKALQQEQARLFAVLDTLPMYVYLQAPDYSVPFVNHTFRKLFGEPDGRPCYEILHGKSEPCKVCPTLRVFQTKHPETWEWTSHTGQTYMVYAHLFPTSDDTDLVLEVGVDITARKQAEKELQQARKTAEDAQRASEDANRAKTEFLANMSHELRTPLNAILGYAQILKIADNLTERQQEGVATIKNSGEHLLTLINEILDLSKIEAGHMELSLSDVPFPEFLKHIADMVRIRAEQKGLAFVYEPDPNLPAGIRADEKRLREVLLNLLGNAVKFTEQGRVTLKVTKVTKVAKVTKIAKHDRESSICNLQFSIEDTGPGIPPEKLNEIFLPFRQIEASSVANEGTGLGLPISHRLVAMMGEELQVNSTVGKGTVFEFALSMPVVDHILIETSAPALRITDYKGNRRTVLVVDDNPANRAVLVGMLLPLGFEILEAQNGQECVEQALRHRPDLIFLDLRMPVLDGFGATQQIRKLEVGNWKLETGNSKLETGNSKLETRNSGLALPAPSTQHPAPSTQYPVPSPQHPVPRTQRPIPIIAVSASVFEQTRQRAFAIGFTDFLTKPFQQEALVNLLQKHLQLEWVYKEIELPIDITPLVSVAASSLVSFPQEDLEILLDLASKSRIKSLLQHLAALEALGEEYHPFIEELRQLAKRFQSKEIVRRLQSLKEVCHES